MFVPCPPSMLHALNPSPLRVVLAADRRGRQLRPLPSTGVVSKEGVGAAARSIPTAGPGLHAKLGPGAEAVTGHLRVAAASPLMCGAERGWSRARNAAAARPAAGGGNSLKACRL